MSSVFVPFFLNLYILQTSPLPLITCFQLFDKNILDFLDTENEYGYVIMSIPILDKICILSTIRI